MKYIQIELGDNKTSLFTCEDSLYYPSCQVFAGEYDPVFLTFINGSRPVIVDVGANIGAFSLWSLKRFNPIQVICYEPIKKNFEALQSNVSNLPEITTSFILKNTAVGAPSNEICLGVTSLACSSFYDRDKGEYSGVFETVENIPGNELPDCNILKLDTEGCEINILEKFLENRVYLPALILLEFHSKEDRLIIDKLLLSYNYVLESGFLYNSNLGVFVYMNSAYLHIEKPS